MTFLSKILSRMKFGILSVFALIALTGCSHADKKTEAQFVAPDKPQATPRSGDTYLHFLGDSPRFLDDCEKYQGFYEKQLQEPISTEEKQAISVWADLNLCICREGKHWEQEKLSNVATENRQTECKLQPDQQKYGLYVNLALRLNERYNGGQMSPLIYYMQCAQWRLQGVLNSDVALVSCLNGK